MAKKRAKQKLEETLELAIKDMPRPKNNGELLKFNKKLINKFLSTVGATKVVIHYDGSGDSGSVEDVSIYKGETKLELPESQFELYELGSVSHTDQTVARLTGKPVNGFTDKIIIVSKPLNDALENFAEEVLSAEGVDWYNNEGGFGDVIFDVKKNKVKVEHNTRIESTEESSWEV